jgi:DNA-binding SARP family transcriptional activator
MGKDETDIICEKTLCWYQDYQKVIWDMEASLRDIDDTPTIIHGALRAAAEFYGGSCAHVVEADYELRAGVVTYEWCADACMSEIAFSRFMPFEVFSRWLYSLENNLPIVTKDIEAINEEHHDEYLRLRERSVSSVLAVPFSKRSHAGFICIDNPRRYADDPSFLSALSYLIVYELSEIKQREAENTTIIFASQRCPTDIQVNLLGKLEIISAKGILRDDDFINEAGYNLLAFLLLNRKKEHSIRSMTEAIWERGETDDPYIAVKNVVYRLRNTLSSIDLRDLILASHGTFTLNPTYFIYTDVERFENVCDKIRHTTSPGVLHMLYESVMSLYRGSLLPRCDYYHWLMPKVIYYQNLYMQQLKGYLRLLNEEGNFLAMQKVATEALSIDIYDSDSHLYLIKAVFLAGSKRLAKTFYSQSSEYLNSEHKQELEALMRDS